MSARALHMSVPTPPGSPRDAPKRTLCGQSDLREIGLAAYDMTDEAPAVTCATCVRRLRRAAALARSLTYATPAVHAERQAPVSRSDALVLARSLRGELDERVPWNSLGALLDHVVPVMQDGRPIRSSSDPDRYGVLPQRTVRGNSDPANGHDNVIAFEKALASVTERIASAADRGAVLGGVEWTRSALATLVLCRPAQDAIATLANAVGKTERQVSRARSLVHGALLFELVRIGLVPRPRRMAEAAHGGVMVLARDALKEDPAWDPSRRLREAAT